jgi:hypothetical protein
MIIPATPWTTARTRVGSLPFSGRERVQRYGEETDDGKDQVRGPKRGEVFPNETERNRQRDDRRDDDDEGRIQHLEAKDDEQQSRHEQDAESDGIGRDRHGPQAVDAHRHLIGSEQAGEEKKDAVERGHFHS